MAFESWDDAMFWNGSLIGYMAGVKSACKDEDKSSLLLRMADTQTRLEFMDSENTKLRKLLSCALISAGYDGRRFLDTYLQEEEGTTLLQELRSLGIEVDG